MVIQAVLAGVLAIPFFFRSKAGRIINTLRRRGDKRDEGAPGS